MKSNVPRTSNDQTTCKVSFNGYRRCKFKIEKNKIQTVPIGAPMNVEPPVKAVYEISSEHHNALSEHV